jgi:hypothetical protein
MKRAAIITFTTWLVVFLVAGCETMKIRISAEPEDSKYMWITNTLEMALSVMTPGR